MSDPAGLADHLLAVAGRLLGGITMAVFVLAAADLVWSRLHWKRRPAHEPAGREGRNKQMQGDPMVKARQRSIALERSRKRMMSGRAGATLVIANPTHYAIALRYVREEGGAPKVVAKGQDLIALKIREIAEEHGIPVIEDKALARSMYDRVEVDMMIPAEFYRVIAELIHFLNRTRRSGPDTVKASRVCSRHRIRAQPASRRSPKALADVATELRLVNVIDLIGYVQGERAANIEDLVHSSAELYFKHGAAALRACPPKPT